MKTLFEFTSKISSVVTTTDPLPADQDQTFSCVLLSNGTLSLKFHDNDGNLRSRISIPLKDAQAVETLFEPGNNCYVMRVNGTQVPLVLPLKEVNELMSQIDNLK